VTKSPLTPPLYLLTYYFICLHIRGYSYVYLHLVTERPLTPPPYLLTYYVRCLHIRGEFIYTTRPPGARSAAIFIYILRHLFTYQSLKLGLFTPRDLLEQGHPPHCLHNTSFVYISDAEVMFIYATWPPGARSSAIFVYIT